jgi:hypothetical protein
MRVSGGGERELAHYQATFSPLLYGVAIAIVLTLLLRETGSAARQRKARHAIAPLNAPETRSPATGQ